jgi:multiple sugar transport system ATP-binding protein
MTMATRLVVMKDGIIQQVGAPKDVYEKPVNVFVGGFIGSPAMNFFTGTLKEGIIKIGEQTLEVPELKMNTLRDQGYIGKEIILGIRPEDFHNEGAYIKESPNTTFMAQVDVAELMGAEIMLYSTFAGQDFVARIDAKNIIQAGDNIELALDMNKAHFFDKGSEQRIFAEGESQMEYGLKLLSN